MQEMTNREKNGTGLTSGFGLKNGMGLTSLDGKWHLTPAMGLKKKRRWFR